MKDINDKDSNKLLEQVQQGLNDKSFLVATLDEPINISNILTNAEVNYHLKSELKKNSKNKLLTANLKQYQNFIKSKVLPYLSSLPPSSIDFNTVDTFARNAKGLNLSVTEKLQISNNGPLDIKNSNDLQLYLDSDREILNDEESFNLLTNIRNCATKID